MKSGMRNLAAGALMLASAFIPNEGLQAKENVNGLRPVLAEALKQDLNISAVQNMVRKTIADQCCDSSLEAASIVGVLEVAMALSQQKRNEYPVRIRQAKNQAEQNQLIAEWNLVNKEIASIIEKARGESNGVAKRTFGF